MVFFSSIMPSSIMLYSSSRCLNVCPTIFQLLLMIANYFQYIFITFLSYSAYPLHTSPTSHLKCFYYFLSVSFMIHVLQLYSAIFQTYVLMSLYLMLRFNFLDVNNLCFLLNAIFAIPTRFFIFLIFPT